MSGNYCLYLTEDPIRFEPVSSATSVFFDESNEQLIIARSNGAGGVVVKSSKSKNIINLRLEEKGELRSLNFSPNSRTLAILRRDSKSIDFINVTPGWDAKEFSQQIKTKNANILGVFWTADLELAVVTDKGVELYQLQIEKKCFKLLKSLSQDINWFLWNAERSTCIISSGPQQNVLHALQFKDSSFSKTPKFEIEVASQSHFLPRKDVLLINLYSQTYVCHSVMPNDTSPLELHLYSIKRDGLVRKSDVLLAGVSGSVVISVVDNLLVVHHQGSKTSLLFDILLENVESVAGVKYHNPLFAALPIRPFILTHEAIPASRKVEEVNYGLYSSSWAVFGPDVILDARLGCYWNVKLDMEALVSIVSDECHLINILMMRTGSKSLILQVFHDLLIGKDRVSPIGLLEVSRIFDSFNRCLVERSDPQNSNQHDHPHHQLIDQTDIHQEILSKLEENQAVKDKFLNSVVIEYLLSLSTRQITTQSFITEFIVNRLILQGDFIQLQQLLQYHVVPDSKTTAFKLLSIENKFPAAYQLAVDMLKRLATSNESILEIFLSKNLLFTAIKYAHANGLSNQLLAQRLLDIAMTSGDDLLFYSIYNYFRNKSFKQRSNSKFYPGDGSDPYLEYYKTKFTSPNV